MSFADDTALIAAGKSLSLVEKIMNEMLAIVYEWLLQCKITLNVSKTVVMTIGNCINSVPTNFIIKSINQIVKRV